MRSTKIGYTREGNLYEKSTKGRKIGKQIGATLPLATFALFSDLPVLKTYQNKYYADFMKKTGCDPSKMNTSRGYLNEIAGNIIPKALDEIGFSKKISNALRKPMGKALMVSGIVVGASLFYSALGGGIGSICDKVKDLANAKKADKKARSLTK